MFLRRSIYSHDNAASRYPHVVLVQPLHERTNVRIAAGGMFKDSADIVAPVVAHLIGQGITDFFLVLHNENRDVSERLVDSFRGRANLTLVHHNNPSYMQAAVTNVILSMVRREGFDVFLPFDADEFFVSQDPQRNLREVITDWLASDNGEQMRVPMLNFLVPRDVEDFRARTLERMPYRVELLPGYDRQVVSSRLLPHFKAIVRLSSVRFAHLTRLVAGSHVAHIGVSKTKLYEPDIGKNVPIGVCHIPWRSRASTLGPPLLGRALATGAPRGETTPSADADASKVLQSTWNEYSLTPPMLDGANLENDVFRLVKDDTCGHILSGIIAAEFDPDDDYCASTRQVDVAGVEFISRVLDDDVMFESAVDAVEGQVKYAFDLRTDGLGRREFRAMQRRKRELQRQLRQHKRLVQEMRSEIAILKNRRPFALVGRVVNKCRRLIRQAISR